MLPRTSFINDMKDSAYKKENGLCIYCSRKCDPFFFDLIDNNPNKIGEMSKKTGPFISHPECKSKFSFISKYKVQYVLYASGMILAAYCTYIIIISGNIYSAYRLMIFAVILMSVGKFLAKNQSKNDLNLVADIKRKQTLRNRMGKEFI